MSDVFSQDKYSLFGSNSISPKDAVQGALGDCWFIAAASAVATDPERIKKIFLTQNLNNAGVYALRLYLLGVPITVSVDEYLAFKYDPIANKLTDDPYYARPGLDGSLWMPILEKAAAKLYGNYEMLIAGHSGPAVQMLTGAPYFETKHEDISSEDLWNYLSEKLAANWVVTSESHNGPGTD